jgi:hypothetical protein
MTALDSVLEETAWMGNNGEIDNLKKQLQSVDGETASLDTLPRDALVGAYVSLQIKTDNFDISAESLSDGELALRVKALVFSEAKKMLDAAESASRKVA